MIFTNKQSIFIDRVTVDCLLSDNKFVKIYNFFLLNEYIIKEKYDEGVDIVVLDICWVLQKFVNFADEKIWYYICKWKKVILVWCIDHRIKRKYWDNVIYIPTTSFKDIENLFNYKIPISLVNNYKHIRKIDQLNTWKNYSNWWSVYLEELLKDIASFQNTNIDIFTKMHIIEVSTWCQFNCSYCNIKKIKGNTKSLPLEEILIEIETEIKKWKTEILLLSDDCWSYWVDIGMNFWDLIKSVLSLSEDISLYIPNINPLHLVKFYDSIKKYIYKWRIAHILVPTQHHSSRILQLMNRSYNIDKLTQVLYDIKKNSKTVLYNQIIFNYQWETYNEFITTFKFLKYYDKTSYYKYSDINNLFWEKFITYDFEKKMILLKRMQKKYLIDVNTYLENTY